MSKKIKNNAAQDPDQDPAVPATNDAPDATNDAPDATNDAPDATNDASGATNDASGATNDASGATPQLRYKAFDVLWNRKIRRVTQADVDTDAALREHLLAKHPDMFKS